MIFFLVLLLTGALVAEGKMCYKCDGGDCATRNMKTEKVACYEKGLCLEMSYFKADFKLTAKRDCVYDKVCDDLEKDMPGIKDCKTCETTLCNWNNISVA